MVHITFEEGAGLSSASKNLLLEFYDMWNVYKARILKRIQKATGIPWGDYEISITFVESGREPNITLKDLMGLSLKGELLLRVADEQSPIELMKNVTLALTYKNIATKAPAGDQLNACATAILACTLSHKVLSEHFERLEPAVNYVTSKAVLWIGELAPERVGDAALLRKVKALSESLIASIEKERIDVGGVLSDIVRKVEEIVAH